MDMKQIMRDVNNFRVCSIPVRGGDKTGQLGCALRERDINDTNEQAIVRAFGKGIEDRIIDKVYEISNTISYSNTKSFKVKLSQFIKDNRSKQVYIIARNQELRDLDFDDVPEDTILVSTQRLPEGLIYLITKDAVELYLDEDIELKTQGTSTSFTLNYGIRELNKSESIILKKG